MNTNRFRQFFNDFKYSIALFALIVLSIYLHKDVFTTDLNGIHLWRQTETQTNIQNFYRYDFNILNPSCNVFNGNKGNIRRYEFPIMQWVIASSYFVFGEKILVTRIWMFIFNALGYIGLFYLLSLITKNRFISLLASSIYFFSPIIFYYSINPMPDTFALSAGIWFLYFFTKYVQSKKSKDLYLSAGMISLAILAKLPFAVYGAAVVGYLLINIKKGGFQYLTSNEAIKVIVSFAISLIVPACWYLSVMGDWPENTTISGIFNEKFDSAKYLAILDYHRNFSIKEMLFNKISVLFFYAGLIFAIFKKPFKMQHFTIYASIFVFVILYFLYELNMIGVIHDYYLLPFMLPLYLVAAYGIYHLYNVHIYSKYVVIFMLFLIPKLTFESTMEWWTLKRVGIPKEWIKYKDELRNAAPDNALCAMLNDDSGYIMPYLMDKQGYCFHSDNLPILWIDDMVRNWKVTYLYSNSRKVDSDTTLQKYIDKVVLEKGTMKVIKLKIPQ